MIFVRSTIFNILSILWSIVSSMLMSPLLLMPRRWGQAGARVWTHGLLFLARVIIGLRHEVRGLENLPDGAVVIAAKHQSAWDTFLFHTLLPDPAYILKRELFFIPFVGWLMKKTGMIGIDRSRGVSALKLMVRGAAAAVAERRQVIIFPEGTRTPPGSHRPYHPGVAMLYQSLDVDVIPVALDSGLFWGRNSFMKKPGVIVVEFLPPMPRGLDRRAFMDLLYDRIESATERLMNQAEQTTPAVEACG
ncbi:MAG: 1-acyl-sn-glycerol-3-phosphate acyltransferase [Alphaproteobacteria bacterium]